MATVGVVGQAQRLLRPPPFLLRKNPIMIFGIGNLTFPNSRNSAGLYMADLLAKRIGVEYQQNRFCSAYVAHYAEEDLLLVKPDTFLVQDNREALRRIVTRWKNIDPQKSIFVYHETQLPVGEVNFITAGRTGHNPALNAIAQDLKTNEFPRIAIGIEHPESGVRFEPTPLHLFRGPQNPEELFLLNKFPNEHWLKLHELALPRFFGAVDRAIGYIRKDFPLSDDPAINLAPGTYEEYEMVNGVPPPPQITKKMRALRARSNINPDNVDGVSNNRYYNTKYDPRQQKKKDRLPKGAELLM